MISPPLKESERTVTLFQQVYTVQVVVDDDYPVHTTKAYGGGDTAILVLNLGI